MASFKKDQGIYYIRIRKWNGYKQDETYIPCKTRLKSEAITRKIQVEKYEKDIKNGTIKKFQFEELFS